MTTATKAGEAVLKPCPFCGNTDLLLVEYMQGTVLHPAYRVHCDNCGASSNFTSNDHIASWNTRVPAQATIDELRAEVERLTREKVAIDELWSVTLAQLAEAVRRLEALKAKQIDVEAVMRLAETMAQDRYCEGFDEAKGGDAVSFRLKWQAAREALRASLLGDGGAAAMASQEKPHD